MGKKYTFENVMLHKSKSWSFEGVQKNGEITNRILISINILGSSGPLLIVVKEDTVVSDVIETALKCYARHGRLPVLGSDATQFTLYCSNVVSQGKIMIIIDLIFFVPPLNKFFATPKIQIRKLRVGFESVTVRTSPC